ncbi:hypothetical protein ES704_02056 [subsurface metagenome]
MDNREAIIKELLAGAAPYPLSKKYPRASVYRIYNELAQSGQLPEIGVTVIDSELGPTSGYPFAPAPATPAPSTTQPVAQVAVKEKEAGVETVDLGPKSFPEDAVNRIRGILGITARPKVLSMPMPELLYPAMVIAVTELGFPAMRPDDFIDTVLYQWLEACDYIPFAYMKKSEIEGYARKYGIIETTKEEQVTQEPEDNVQPEPESEPVPEGEVTEGLTEEEQDYEAAKADQPEPEPGFKTWEEIADEALPEPEPEPVETEENINEKTEAVVEEPHKPTVGDLLKRLHIENIKKEVDDDSTGRTESISPQSGDEPRE